MAPKAHYFHIEQGTAPSTLRAHACPTREWWQTSRDRISGGVAERLIAPVLKTGRPKGLVSSNLTPSAISIADCGLRIRSKKKMRD
jgi:hypothetical protein